MTTQQLGIPLGKTGQAKVLDDKELKMVLKIIDSGHHAKRNTAIVCSGQVKQDSLLSRLFIKFPLILNRGLIA